MCRFRKCTSVREYDPARMMRYRWYLRGWDIGPTLLMGPSPMPSWNARSHGHFHKGQPLYIQYILQIIFAVLKKLLTTKWYLVLDTIFSLPKNISVFWMIPIARSLTIKYANLIWKLYFWMLHGRSQMLYVCIEVALRGIAHGKGRSNWAKGRDPSGSWVQYPNPAVPTTPRHARWNVLTHFRAFSAPTLL